MRVNRGLVFWGVALVTAGAVALAIQSDLIAGDTAREAWRLWPIVLIVIGVAVISARTPFALVATLAAGLVAGGLAGTLVAGLPDGMAIGCGGETDSRTAANGDFTAASARVELDFDCGDLAVAMDQGTAWNVEARYGSDSEPQISSDAGSMRVELRDAGGFIGFNDSRQDWDVTLPLDVELALDVDANAASSTLDLDGGALSEVAIDANAGEVRLGLGGTAVDDLSIDANAGSITMTVDQATTAIGRIEMNAGNLDLCVGDGVAIAITLNEDNITFSHDLDDSGLTRSGDTWRSGDGTADVTLEIQGNAASFTYNPDGGCS
ncbi:MAG TPA: DUF5668 domain-containing protein [Candidatus Limnocylindria bacterium]|nr:DUF5668 domain-containing protein [Candidatus Limnocylindria bacterium]